MNILIIAIHTKSYSPIVSNLGAEEITFPLTHPQKIVRDIENDRWVDKNVFRINFKTVLYFINYKRFVFNVCRKIKKLVIN